ncbi:hypothetical protein [Burkholderia singularis]|uniref:Uncharacterized protein n=1 Tax=Burkholderia singularis TaxID=1503053 RepID=A0A238HBE1_9BURK|nr:hypothetical protein [Burkholderia singularis]SMG02756.1 FIG00453022: hypothetical protein [Burkholderia singularis]
MNTHTLSGMLHAQELLLVSLIRTLAPETKRELGDEFIRQIELAETSHLDVPAEHDAHHAYLAHVRRLLIRLESLS